MLRPGDRFRRRLRPAGHGATNRFEQPVQGGRAGGQQPLPHFEVQVQVAMTFHRFHQMGQRGLQALAANAVGGLPGQDHRLTDRLVVDASALDH